MFISCWPATRRCHCARAITWTFAALKHDRAADPRIHERQAHRGRQALKQRARADAFAPISATGVASTHAKLSML